MHIWSVVLPDFTPFGYIQYIICQSKDYAFDLYGFMTGLFIHYIICQSNDYVYGLVTGLFAWISPTALSWTFIKLINDNVVVFT